MPVELSAADLAAWSVALDTLDGVPHGRDAIRAASLSKHSGPLDLGCELNPSIRRTPALELLSAELERLITTPGARLVVSFAPQEGKTSALRMALLRKLQLHPERRNVIASYSVDLARTSGRAVRQIIDAYGSNAVDPATGQMTPDLLGIEVARDHSAAADWTLRGYDGGLVCVGVGSGLTGRPIDGVLAVDDPLKDARDADSALMLSRLHDWWAAVSETRLAPESSVVVIATRWAERDLSGWLIEQDEALSPDAREWRVVNIPALADGVTPDALNRPVGEWMESARGRTREQWERVRHRVGERVFAALYQGRPAPLGGGIFLTGWFDRDRVTTRPLGSPPVVVVDPADNTGSGDEAGIMVVSTDTQQQGIYLGPDYSGHYTTARWVRVALLAVVRHGAAALAYEQSLSGLDRSVRDGWRLLWKQARALRRQVLGVWSPVVDPDVVESVTVELCHPDDPDTTWGETRAQLLELWPLVALTLDYPDTGPSIRRIVAKGSKQLRMQLAAPLWEQRRVHHVGQLAALEHQLCQWQPGQDSPDRADAAIHAVMVMSGATSATLSTPDRGVPLPTRSTRQRRSTVLPRSTMSRR